MTGKGEPWHTKERKETPYLYLLFRPQHASAETIHSQGRNILKTPSHSKWSLRFNWGKTIDY